MSGSDSTLVILVSRIRVHSGSFLVIFLLTTNLLLLDSNFTRSALVPEPPPKAKRPPVWPHRMSKCHGPVARPSARPCPLLSHAAAAASSAACLPLAPNLVLRIFAGPMPGLALEWAPPMGRQLTDSSLGGAVSEIEDEDEARSPASLFCLFCFWPITWSTDAGRRLCLHPRPPPSLSDFQCSTNYPTAITRTRTPAPVIVLLPSLAHLGVR